MAQLIQIKRSVATAIPTTLQPGEVAYSEADGGKFFIGKADGSIVVIGGEAMVAKLAGIEANATGDMTNEEILAALVANSDVNVLTDAQLAKLSAIEEGATGDQTAEEILTALLQNANTNVLTDAQVAKLNGLESSHYKGLFADKATLDAVDTAGLVAGDYADVDLGAGSEVARHIWDASDSVWAEQAGASNAETNVSVKEKYEANEDTNAFTDAEKAKLAGVEAGATGDMTGAEIVAAAVAESDFNAFTDAEKQKLADVDNMKVDGGTF